jgi:hypothetical protein
MSHIILRSHWCESIVLNIHAPTEDKVEDMKGSFYKELQRVFDKFPKYCMKILTIDCSAKVSKEDIMKPVIWNEKLVMVMELQ